MACYCRLVSTNLGADAGPSHSSAPTPQADTTAAQAEKAIEVFGSYSTKGCPSVVRMQQNGGWHGLLLQAQGASTRLMLSICSSRSADVLQAYRAC